jgi:hypothetical protein
MLPGPIRVLHLQADAPLSLLPLPREAPTRRLPEVEAPAPVPPARKRDSAQEKVRLPNAADAPPSNAITLPLDLSPGGPAKTLLDQVEAERRWRNLAGPSDAQLELSRSNAPLSRDYHQSGDTERSEGEVITWVSDKCFYTTQGITTFGMPQTRKVCKDPPKPETELFKGMRKKLDERENGKAP